MSLDEYDVIEKQKSQKLIDFLFEMRHYNYDYYKINWNTTKKKIFLVHKKIYGKKVFKLFSYL